MITPSQNTFMVGTLASYFLALGPFAYTRTGKYRIEQCSARNFRLWKEAGEPSFAVAGEPNEDAFAMGVLMSQWDLISFTGVGEVGDPTMIEDFKAIIAKWYELENITLPEGEILRILGDHPVYLDTSHPRVFEELEDCLEWIKDAREEGVRYA